MRVLQLSDTHLRGDDRLSFRVVDTRHCLDAAVAYVKNAAQKPECIVITGDLADSGDLEAYRILHRAVGSLGVPVYAIPGNHDRRDRMRDVLGDWCPADGTVAPYICYTMEDGPFRLVMMDTMRPGSHSGHCPPEVAAWLERTLAERPETPTLLFMHHPPFCTGLGVMDEPFENLEALAAVLRANPQVRLCCGHMHRPIVTEWAGRLAMTAPSVSMQMELDLSPSGGDEFRMEAPGCLLHDWRNGVWNSHVCQIPDRVTFAGPYPFADSVNPAE
ncbi:MAG: phosphodiesterase [Deltaproteobacteria bacterium]|nr:phosphodiesterase [Deltaproteobacteria bacterium]